MTRGRMIVWTAAKLEALRTAIKEAEGNDHVVFVDRGSKNSRMNIRHFMSMSEAVGLEREVTSDFERNPQPKFPENREGGEP